jgi:molecular chaperone GrpE
LTNKRQSVTKTALAELLTTGHNHNLCIMENEKQQSEVTDNGNVAAEIPVSESREGKSEGAAPKENDVVRLQSELGESKEKYLRLYSEFENFRRRTAKEKLEMIQTANERLLKELLPVADDFERAEKSFREKNDKDSEGFLLIQNKFKKVLEQFGVKLMDVKQGSDFNPDLHEAITQIPSPAPELKDKVVEVVEKGYLLNDKVVRHAKVVVGN